MKRRMTAYRQWLFSLAAASLCLGACSRGGEAAEAVAVPLEIYSRANGTDPEAGDMSGEACRLFFWEKTAFETWLGGELEEPLFECTPEEAIDHYRYSGGIAYNTGEEYPENGSWLYATGYAPKAALDLTVTAQEKTLRVREGFRDGQTDFLVCDGCEAHKGCSADRFTEPEHELQFRHLTARVRFVGIRDEVMYNKIGVNNVTIQLHEEGLVVPVRFDWRANADETACTYVANLENASAALAPVESGEEMIPATAEGRTLGSCYVLQARSMEGYDPFGEVLEASGKISLTMDIEADLWYIAGDRTDKVFYTRKRWEGVSVDIDSHTGNVMRPGYEYVVNITFNNESIVLQGLQKGWEDGGTHYIPVRPNAGEAN